MLALIDANLKTDILRQEWGRGRKKKPGGVAEGQQARQGHPLQTHGIPSVPYKCADLLILAPTDFGVDFRWDLQHSIGCRVGKGCARRRSRSMEWHLL